MPRKIDPEKVVYLAPETLKQQEIAERLAATSDPAEIMEILNSRPTKGQFREYLGDEVVDGPEGTTVLAPKFGDLVQWVDESPDDPTDGSGHYAVYSGDEADYAPKKVA